MFKHLSSKTVNSSSESYFGKTDVYLSVTIVLALVSVIKIIFYNIQSFKSFYILFKWLKPILTLQFLTINGKTVIYRTVTDCCMFNRHGSTDKYYINISFLYVGFTLQLPTKLSKPRPSRSSNFIGSRKKGQIINSTQKLPSFALSQFQLRFKHIPIELLEPWGKWSIVKGRGGEGF